MGSRRSTALKDDIISLAFPATVISQSDPRPLDWRVRNPDDTPEFSVFPDRAPLTVDHTDIERPPELPANRDAKVSGCSCSPWLLPCRARRGRRVCSRVFRGPSRGRTGGTRRIDASSPHPRRKRCLLTRPECHRTSSVLFINKHTLLGWGKKSKSHEEGDRSKYTHKNN